MEEISNDTSTGVTYITTAPTVRFTLDSSDRPRQWKVWAGEKEGLPGIWTSDGRVNVGPEDDFKMRTPTFKKATEKNIGKANYITAQDQAFKMVEMEVGKKERANYFSSIEDAVRLKKWLPMLCPAGMKWTDYKGKVLFPGLVSNKLDGARCNIMLVDGVITAFTRTGKQWHNFKHLVEDEHIVALFALYPDIILDGEAYNHEYKDNFEGLISIFKKETPTEEEREFSALNSKYHIYDIYIGDSKKASAVDRQRLLLALFATLLKDSTACVCELSTLVFSNEEYDVFHTTAMDEGYEGTIFREAVAPYDVDKRSKKLLKRKDIYDCEFIVTGIVEMEGNMAGSVNIDLGTASGGGDELAGLNTTAIQNAGMARGWDDDKCRELLRDQDIRVNTVATIEHFGVTNKGKLRFAKIKAFRDYE